MQPQQNKPPPGVEPRTQREPSRVEPRVEREPSRAEPGTERQPSRAEPQTERQPSKAEPSISPPEEEPYNPFEHRNVKKPTTDFGALAHMLKTSLGSGILAMPMAFKNSGLILGTVGTIVLGIICTHCIQMLIRSSQILCVKNRVPVLTYPDTAEKAFLDGPKSIKKHSKGIGITVTVQLLASFTLGSTVYVVFMSETMHQVCKFFWNVNIHVRYFALMLWIPLILICMLPNLRSLVPFSVMANILVIISFSFVVYYIVRSIHPTSSVHLVAPPERFPLFLCTVIFAIEGIGTVITIENEMEHPEHFIGGRCGIAFIAMTIVVTVYTIIGFLGYLQYGEATAGSITLNLPIHEPLGQSVKIMIALAIFFTYGLQFYVPINILFDMFKNRVHPKRHILLQILIRTGLVSATVIMAIVIPNLEPIIGIVGAICFSTLGLLMPSLIDIMVRHPNFGRFKWRLLKNIIIATISVVTLVCGLTISLIQIVKMYMK